MTPITDPAADIAAARCLAARSVDDEARTATHPRPCRFCETPLAELRGLVENFNAWVRWRPEGSRGGVVGRHEVRTWLELPREQRERLVAAAARPEVGP